MSPGPYPYPVPARVKLRGRACRILGYIFAPIGLAALIGGILLLHGRTSAVNDFQHVAVAARHGTITFHDTGTYVAYYEAATIDTSALPPVGIELTAPDGTRTEVDTTFGNRSDGKIEIVRYHLDGRDGVALYQFSIEQTGTYQVDIRPSGIEASGSQLAFGKSILGSQLGGTLLLILGIVGLLAAIVLLVIGFVRRARHNRELANAPPPPPYGWPPPSPGQMGR